MTTIECQVIPRGGLVELEQQLKRDLELTVYPERDWTNRKPESDTSELDVLIIGGGQSGISVAFGLMRQRIGNILVVDENPRGKEGPWRTFARMITLRTPKYITGPDQGIPNLTFRAWYEAQWGAKAWEELQLIPKEQWADYLLWYRTFLEIPYKNDVQAGAMEWLPERNRFAVPLIERIDGSEFSSTVYPRKIVLSTGIDGSGRWEVPEVIKKNLPPDRFAHTRHEIDFDRWRDKRVAILGAGASAFDNASVALETGCSEVHLLFRRKTLPNINPYRWAEFVGFLNHHSDLADAERWKFILKILRMGQLPPTDTYARATKFPQFQLHPGCSWDNIEFDGHEIKITTNNGPVVVDFVVVGTGFITDLSLRPELKNLYPHIALWQDRYHPPQQEQHEDLGRHPYLGPHFELQEKTPGKAPYINSVFNYTFGCLPSQGFGGASISGLKYSLPKVVSGVTRQLYLDDCAQFYEALENFDLREF